MKLRIKGWVTPEGHTGAGVRGGAYKVDLTLETEGEDHASRPPEPARFRAMTRERTSFESIRAVLEIAKVGDRFEVDYTDAKGRQTVREVRLSTLLHLDNDCGWWRFMGVTDDGPRWYYLDRINSLRWVGRAA